MDKLKTLLIHIPILLFFIAAGAPVSAAEACDTVLRGDVRTMTAESAHDVDAATAAEFPDSLRLAGSPEMLDSLYFKNHYWWNMLKNKKLKMNDPEVIWPRFLGFCVKVYNWGDHFFNGYDPEWVVGTGKRWKVRLENENWSDSYAMHLPGKHDLLMLSEFNSNIGPYIQYMAVSIGYSWNLNHMIGGKPIKHKRTQFGFNCARFDASLYYAENKGGTYLRSLGNYKNGKLIKEYFPGLELTTFGVDLIYFFNNHRYSHGAAYNYSRIQKKSAGSIIGGFSYCNRDIKMDFSTLDESMKPYYPLHKDRMKFHYFNFAFIVGYGYNFVLNPHLLLNITAMPCIGFNHCYEDSTEGSGELFSLGGKGRMSLVYNLKNLFTGINFKADADWYKSDSSSLFTALESISATIGYRF